MNHPTRFVAPIVILFATGALAITPAPRTATPAPSTATDGAQIKAALESIREIRERQLIERDDDGFRMPSDQPGLTLTWRLALPDGARLLDVRQPKKMVAEDSSGRDLSNIMPNFMNEKEWISTVEAWGEPIEQVQFQLAVSSRTAQTFNLNATFDAITYRSTEAVEILPGDTFAPIGHEIDGEAITARLVNRDNKPQLEVRPGAARMAVESVTAAQGDLEVESNSSMWDDTTTTYFLETSYTEDTKVIMVLRTGIESVPITLELKEHPLP